MIKKMMALILALAMAMSMTSTAFAAELTETDGNAVPAESTVESEESISDESSRMEVVPESEVPEEVLNGDSGEDDGNDYAESATPISVNRTATGAISTSEDVDYYKFTTPSAGSVYLTFAHEFIESSSNYWIVTFYNSSLQEYYSYYMAGSKSSYNTSKVGLPSGTYYIRVEGYSISRYSSVPYQLTANFMASSAWETENNGYSEQADLIDVNTTFNGTIHNSEDVDYYKFTTPSAGFVYLTFAHEFIESSSNYWIVTFYNSSLQEYYSYYMAGSKSSYNTSKVGLPSGTYYIRVEGYSISRYSSVPYQLTANFVASDTWETENNNYFENADPIDIGTAYSGTIHNSGDVDYYKFTVSKAGNFKLNFKHDFIDSSSSYWYSRILKSNGNSVTDAYYFSGSTTNANTGTFYLNAGTYYLEVGGYSTYTYSDIPYIFTLKSTLVAPTLKSAKASGSNIVFKWGKVSGATGYYVYRKAGSGKWKKIATIKNGSTTSYTDKSVKKGTVYTYSVKAYNSSMTSSYKTTGVAAIVLSTPAKPAMSNPNSSYYYYEAKSTWKKVAGATGYEVQFARNNTFKVNTWTYSTNGTAYTIYSLNDWKNKKVYSRVRAYRVVNGTRIYSGWSKVGSVMIKK